MYLPKHFEATDGSVIDRLVKDYPLANLVLVNGTDPWPTVDPVVLYGDGAIENGGQLFGHVARANPLASCGQGTPVTAIFMGPRVYISPNWYLSKSIHHRVVPTYNYGIVVVQGRMQLLHEPGDKLRIVKELTERFEKGQPQPWSVEDAPKEFIEGMLGNIVGLSIRIEHVQAKFKLSQNRDARDRHSVQMELEGSESKTDAQIMARWMEDLI